MPERMDGSAGRRGVLVRKYGGSSLASIDRVRAVADDLVRKRAEGYDLVVVVSAMGRTTDDLLHLARQANPDPPRRELDMLLTVGERVSMSLLSMALAAAGCPAISFTGSQVGIITDTSHTDARIVEVKADRVREALAAGQVVVVAGFQGVSVAREITTLGRGGSDTTAVALAAALRAVRCEILKDVDGVYSADPHRVPGARRHARLSYEQMRRIAAAGSGVIHARAVEYAARHQVPLLVGSSFRDGPGTLIGDDGAAALASAGEPAGAGASASPALPAAPAGPGAPAGPPPPAGAPAARAPAPAWRALAMVVREDAALLEVAGAPPDGGAAWWRRVSEAIAGAELHAEWLERTDGRWRWSAVADPAVLAAARDALLPLAERDGAQLLFRRGCACVSLAGEPPAAWAGVQARVAAVMAQAGIDDWVLRADGAALRLLVTAGELPRLLEPLHAALAAG